MQSQCHAWLNTVCGTSHVSVYALLHAQLQVEDTYACCCGLCCCHVLQHDILVLMASYACFCKHQGQAAIMLALAVMMSLTDINSSCTSEIAVGQELFQQPDVSEIPFALLLASGTSLAKQYRGIEAPLITAIKLLLLAHSTSRSHPRHLLTMLNTICGCLAQAYLLSKKPQGSCIATGYMHM